MKYLEKTLVAFVIVLGVAVFASAQDSKSPTDEDKNAVIPTSSYLKRGAPIGNSAAVSLNVVLKDPAKFQGKTVLVEGVVVRSCKMEGCWAEVAENKDSKSVRVKMKDHSFFIPLQSADSLARVEGTVEVKTLTKAMVDHMIAEDGAKFDNRNADGTVIEVSFEATGIELKRAT